ncbi:type II toxin-antitoxin system YafQ family toxin (plasmid) [Helicobacter pylori]|uniref:type II toxin-antitoxin system YafQ family toxin n=1 Tax=Helicobacter pylori TaxID=210 RepID=UPI001FD1C32B|nr:type II toxin-antitoxin system YafQ family toxin [Helicobacter pylori]UOR41448.1 type II toxin-antitoxin system YafQ family toxin [Helicobacter pylori]UOS50145.1 type II toxin-antitoxin system YafQ family toxin [Helicobacter pylori]
MLDIEYHNMFRKDYKKYLKNGFDSKLLDEVVLELRQQKPLAPKQYPCRECHIKPNILLVYTVKNNTLWLLRLGSHSELF